MRKRGKKTAPGSARVLAPELEVTRLLQQGRAQQALQTAIRALSAGRRNSDLSNLAGVCAATFGDETLAIQLWLHAIELNPQYAQAWFNLGVAHQKKGLEDEAEQAFRHAVECSPDNIEAWAMLGDLLYGRRRLDEAKMAYELLLARDPAHAHAHNNLGLIYAAENQPEQALMHYQQALSAAPDSPEILSNYANLLSSLRRETEAESLLKKALRLAPDSAPNHTNLGVLYANMGRPEAAEDCFNQALQLQPDYALPRLNLGYAQLKAGNFRAGWANHEARYSPHLPDNSISFPDINAPQWQGETLDGKHLLIWVEQGYGDTIQFVRYLALLKKRWRLTITLICRQPLLALLQTLDSADFVYTAEQAPAEGYDCWVLLLSLPLLCGTDTEQDIPADLPYLAVPSSRAEKWHNALPEHSLKIGLAWQGNPSHQNNNSRSIASESLAPLLDIPEAYFVSLQPEAPPPGFYPLPQLLQDFADTAALITQLDLVISVDTAVAHLAGALGKPCWLLLPRYRTDWRWLEERDNSPWYPGVMRLFRQGADESWTPVIKQIRAAIAALRIAR